jgi:hypothetical protein
MRATRFGLMSSLLCLTVGQEGLASRWIKEAQETVFEA